MNSERAEIVAWLRAEHEAWQALRASYVKRGNHGPYLGGPSYAYAAFAIERGQHLGLFLDSVCACGLCLECDARAYHADLTRNAPEPRSDTQGE